MRKKSMSYIIKTMALLMAGVVGLNAIKVEAAKRGDEITVPEDAWASEYINSLELQSYTVYTQNGDVRGEFYYNASGVFIQVVSLYHWTTTLDLLTFALYLYIT